MSIIRNRPKDLSLDEYLQLLRVNFSKTNEKYSEQILNLKHSLLDAKKEILYLKIKDQINNANSLDSAIGSAHNFQSTNQNENKTSDKKYNELNSQFSSNIEFISNIIKLKTIDKNFRSNQEIDQETVLECLIQLLKQFSTFLFQYDFEEDLTSLPMSSSMINLTDSIDYLKKYKTFCEYFIPIGKHFAWPATILEYLRNRMVLLSKKQAY